MQAAAMCSSVCAMMPRVLATKQPQHPLRFATRSTMPAALSAVKRLRGSRKSAGGRQLHVSASYGSEWNTPLDAYVTLGLAHCFEKGDDGKLQDRYLIEPITANSLECMANGAKTCYMHVCSLTLGQALSRNKGALPAEFAQGLFCEGYEARADAAARTWMRPHALDNLLDIVPLGQVKSSFNYSTDDKRVLNLENVVNDDDNIKQDISIDVYNRAKADEYKEHHPSVDLAAGEEGGAAGAEEEEDELDALLAG